MLEPNTYSSANESFFASLDAPFRNIETATEPILFQTKDHLVQWKFELPIPTFPGSMVKYSFMTTLGDISFGASFTDKNEKEPEVLIEACRVPSDVEPVMGSFKARREGTLLLTFDNSFSWFNPKLLTYKVALFQPPFSQADEARSIKSRSLLDTIVEDIKRSEKKLSVAQDQFLDLEDEVSGIEDKIASLETQLEAKKKDLIRAIDDAQLLTDRIYASLEMRNGLCIRCLTKPLLAHVLSYLGGTKSSVSVVCKYWYYICTQLERESTSKSRSHTLSNDLVKLTIHDGQNSNSNNSSSSSNSGGNNSNNQSPKDNGHIYTTTQPPNAS